MGAGAKAAGVGATRVARGERSRSLWSYAWERFKRNRLAVFGLAGVVLFVLAAAVGPAISPYDYAEQDLMHVNMPPSREHLLGTDELGRDLLTRLLWGARTGLLVGIISTGVSAALGVIVGGLAAMNGGWVDALLMRVTDVFLSFPGLLLAAFLNATLRLRVVDLIHRLYELTGWGFLSDVATYDYLVILFVLALAGWPGTARLVRGQMLRLREEEFVQAAIACGAGGWRVLVRHLFPNTLGPLVVSMTAGFGSAILSESALSFMGLGIRPPGASWGAMINESLIGWRFHPHLVAAPAGALALVVFAVNVLGDGLNDALNPKMSD